jgi:tetratricopeptide (TPR) repeat protein
MTPAPPQERLKRVFLERCETSLSQMALREGLISAEQNEEALAEQKLTGRSLREILLARGWIDAARIDALVARWADLEFTGGAEVEPVSARSISEFDLVGLISESPSAQVWRAWDRRVQRWVAIKMLRPRRGSESRPVRFRAEALAAGRLQHPHIVPIFHLGEEQGITYIVMPFIEGRTLNEARLSLKEALQSVRTCALAVEHAHRRGVVHRDLKPENLMIDSENRVWVLDFGLAYLKDLGDSPTMCGTVMGTPAYMSPEQARGERSARQTATDVYGLGATLYQLATGVPPFSGESLAEIVRKVCDEEPVPPRLRNPKISRELETVILKAIQKDPRNRYASASEFAEDLARIESGLPIRARRAGAGRRIVLAVRRRPWVLSFLMVPAVAWAALHLERSARVAAREETMAVLRGTATQSVDLVLNARRRGSPVPPVMMQVLSRLYLQATALDPDLAEPHYLMGRLERARMRDDSALEYQRLALRHDRQYVPALVEQVVLLSRRCYREGESPRRKELQRSLREACARLQASAQGDQDPSQEVALAIAACELGLEGARERLIEAARKNPSREEGFETLARMSIDLEERLRWYTEGLDHDQGYVDHWIGRADTHLARAELLSKQGQDPLKECDSAECDYRAATRLQPNNSYTWWRWGLVQSCRAEWNQRRNGPRSEIKTWEAAVVNFTRALGPRPAFAPALLSRASARTQKALAYAADRRDPFDDLSGAEMDYTRLYELDPQVETLILRAEVRTLAAEMLLRSKTLWGLGRTQQTFSELIEGAMSDYGRSESRVGPDRLARILLGRGRIRLCAAGRFRAIGDSMRASQNYDAAREDLERAVKLDPALETQVGPLLAEAKRGGS